MKKVLDIFCRLSYNMQAISVAAMAQSVARILGKDEVTGSNPVSSSMKKALALASAFFNEIRLTASEISCGYEIADAMKYLLCKCDRRILL